MLEEIKYPLCPKSSYRWKTYTVRVSFKRLQERDATGQVIPLLSRENRPSLKDTMLFPQKYRMCSKEDLLFYVAYQEKLISITPENIDGFEDVMYWCGFRNDRDKCIKSLRQAKWKLHKPSDKPEDMYLSVCGRRTDKASSTVDFVPLGWYDILPEDVTAQAKENSWRLEVKDPVKEVSNIPEEAELYADAKCTATMMSIPIVFYSTKEEDGAKVEKTMYLDLRKLRNLHLLFEHGKTMYGKESACHTNLDLFDAMMAYGTFWVIDKMQDSIYLPSLPRPPRYSKGVLVTLSLSKDSPKNITTIHDVLHLLSEDTLKEIKKKFYPHIKHWSKKIEKEVLNRLGASKTISKFGPGVCLNIGKKLMCALPEGLMFL